MITMSVTNVVGGLGGGVVATGATVALNQAKVLPFTGGHTTVSFVLLTAIVVAAAGLLSHMSLRLYKGLSRI
jgi:hypothetical protein